MSANSRLFRAAGEVGVVVLGVVIALAADSWRQGLLDRRSESTHLVRIRGDLETGRTQILQLQETFLATRRAAWTLAEALDGGSASATQDSLIALSLAAARTGFVAANVAHDRTYRELLTRASWP